VADLRAVGAVSQPDRRRVSFTEEIGGRDVEQTIWSFVLAGFAGFVNYLQRFATPEKPAWNPSECYVKVITGAFVGYLTLLLIGKRLEDAGLVWFAVAIAGYGGPLTLDFFQQLFRDAISRAAQNSQNNPPKN
jgi:hypothetical protein